MLKCLWYINNLYPYLRPSLERKKKTMTTKLNWKLKQLPTASEVADLVHNKIITASEAKQMLFTVSDDKDPTVTELKRQIEFLEGLVKELSKDRTTGWINTYVTTMATPLPRVVYTSGTLTGSTAGTINANSYTSSLANL